VALIYHLGTGCVKIQQMGAQGYFGLHSKLGKS